MTKIFWTVSLAALCAALGCDEVAGQPERDGSTSGAEGDLDLGSGDSSRCADDSADAEGCVCTAGAPPRACSSGAEGNDGACSSGVQECVSGDSSEIESSTWGPCQPTEAPGGEGCAKDPNDDCNDAEHDCSTDGNDRNCCATQLEECLANGDPPSVCASLDEMCAAVDETAGGVQKRAAELLRIKPTTLNEMIKRYDIRPRRKKASSGSSEHDNGHSENGDELEPVGEVE